ncbi:hypothetical protein, unlikely [Trypanosoma congolense IL3000]|uniref:Uncharacterized protein n=1 Tax=Trypanosoma congolense (strain IL3000) TaxID=1068625 RepID=F9W6V9_TRYCI|nr:hypothetical protein, unlikely [Trypanosoma congolense IL3000]
MQCFCNLNTKFSCLRSSHILGRILNCCLFINGWPYVNSTHSTIFHGDHKNFIIHQHFWLAVNTFSKTQHPALQDNRSVLLFFFLLLRHPSYPALAYPNTLIKMSLPLNRECMHCPFAFVNAKFQTGIHTPLFPYH